ncbi:flavodoxin family protein [Aestuariicella hydrocarbonica]|uniref:Flavodoxin family protein n=1 Tax=Pseudomaricurvus hydrocarbonicus TaxID=1470433 RepID=A0A9E5JRJ4_9GAMM|nr:NAD(P)H-dependent oxidoreductase [Aestuariicella hydrocarbonica]NHO65219.1 flavodoxin family protein [Aestuariicella hydrocarbonica]
MTTPTAKKHLLIVYHTQSGNTGQLAEAVWRGASLESESVETRLVRAADGQLEDLLWCDAVLFGTPENFGYMSGMLKDFFDRTYYPAEPYELNRPYGLFISAGNDGTGAVRECDRILLGYPMKKVLEPLIARGEITAEHLASAEELGQTLACGLSMGVF